MKLLSNFVTDAKGKWITVLFWFLLVFLASLGPSLMDVTENNASSFLPKGADSTLALEVSREAFPSDGVPLMIIFANQNGLSLADYETGQDINKWLASDQLPDSVGRVTSIYNVPAARSELVSPDGTTMNMIVNLIGEPSSDEFINVVKDIREYVHQFRSDNLAINVGGPGGLISDLVAVFATIDVFLLLASAVLVLVLLVIIYRSPVIPFIPLIAVSFVYFVAGAVGALMLKQFGFNVNGQATGIMTIILFGSGTDYCLFISSRYREELLNYKDKHEAMNITINAVGPAVLSSGSTILVASAILLLANLGSSAALGPILAIALFIMMIAAITFVPAVLLILGRFSFWPIIPRFQANPVTKKRVYGVIAAWVLERPMKVISVSIAVLAILSSGILLYNPNYDSLASLPADTESVKGFQMLRNGFPAGEISPSYAYLVTDDDFNQEGINTIDKIAMDIYNHPNVADVSTVSRPFGINGLFDKNDVNAVFFTDIDNQNNLFLKNSAARFISKDSKVFRFDIVFDDNPFSSVSLTSINELRVISKKSLDELNLNPAYMTYGGETAEATDTRTAINRDNLIVLPLVLLSIAIILAILLRSLVAPLYLCLTILVTFAGTLGISLIFFEYVFGHSGISPGTLFYVFVFLNALGVDYNIYVMSRIREEAKKKPLDLAVKDAVSVTGGVITSAGLILAGTFAVFMTLPLIDLFQLGFAVSIGVIMDTFVTRTIIVPAIVSKLGDTNWWPSKLEAS